MRKFFLDLWTQVSLDFIEASRFFSFLIDLLTLVVRLSILISPKLFYSPCSFSSSFIELILILILFVFASSFDDRGSIRRVGALKCGDY